MPDIKTRDVVKGTIKTVDKTAVAGERMKDAYIRTKYTAEHLEITKELFCQFDEFELQDLSFLNEVDNHYEHSDLSESSLDRRMTTHQESPEEATIRREQFSQLHSAIEKLPSRQQHRLRLYYFEGLTYEEIARKEGCSFQAVAKSVTSAERKLKYILSEG